MNNKYLFALIFQSILLFSQISNINCNLNDENDPNKQLIVISAPLKEEKEYQSFYNDLIDFQARLANSIIGKDNVIVIGEKETLKLFEAKGVKSELLLEAPQGDIWIRDFASAFPKDPVLFKYKGIGNDAPQVQKFYAEFAQKHGLEIKKSDLLLDGGNFVHNGVNKVIISDQVLKVNPNMKKEGIINEIKKQTGIKDVAIIPRDEQKLGHSQGQVVFLDEKTILMNSYSKVPGFADMVQKAIKESLADVEIKMIEGEGYGESVGKYVSVCGVYVNSLITNKYIYMPSFNDQEKNKKVLQDFVSNVNGKKTIIQIDSSKVCGKGGSTKTLTQQLEGQNAKKLILAARKYSLSYSTVQTFCSLVIFSIMIIIL